MSKYIIQTVLTNESESGIRFSEWDEPLDDWLVNDDGTPDYGRIYKLMVAEYGHCQSSVYIDRTDGSIRRCGWFFVKRQDYDGYVRDGDPKTYVRGAWVTILRIVEPAHKAIVESVDMGGR